MNLFDLCVYKNLNKESGGDVDVSSLVATENKTYNAGEGKAYNPVVVNVPTPPPSLQSLTASHNGYFVPSSGYDGFSEVNVDVALPQNAYLLESQKNDVVTIQHGAEFDMPKLIASIEPQQDLHGYDSPWVGGAGKNKLPNAVNTMTKNGITITKNSDGTYTLNGTSTNGNTTICLNSPTGEGDDDYGLSLPNGDYYLSGLSGGTTSTYRMNVDIAISDHQSRSISHFDGDTSFTIENNNVCSVSLWVNKEGQTFNNFVISPMIRLASVTDSTFAPYSNECPISGWTACNVVRTGKNLVYNTISKATISSNGEFVIASSLNSDMQIAQVKKGIVYTITSDELFVGGFFTSEPINGSVTYNNSRWADTPKTFTSPIDGYVAFRTSNGYATPQIELGTQSTPYEPYNGNTYTINFVDGSNPLTVYGGTLDVLSGVLTVTDAYCSSPLTWQKNTGWGYTFFNANSVINDKKENVACNYYKAVSKSRDSLLDGEIGTWNTTSSFVPCIRDDSKADLTAEEFTTAMSGLTFTYKLATPQTYQLTPTQVKSLLGVNNIFADTGKVDVQIWTKEVTS